MAHRYGDPVRVSVAAGDAQRPTSFSWRDRRYGVRVLATWRLRTNWWQPQAADRTYYRVVTADHQVFELYQDINSSAWVLDAVQD